MHGNGEFGRFHPLVNFIYFVAVIGFSMLFMHPFLQVIAFLSAFTYSVILKGRKAAIFNLAVLIPLILTTALINPLFNHEGVTVIAYLPSGNPLTLESMLYGVSAGVMLATVICIFSCFNEVMTSDKLICLFGRIIPALSLILSMTLRFVPRFKTQLAEVRNAQRNIGMDITSGNVIVRAKKGLSILSVMITWCLENAIDTADSMKSRGYGLSGRTSYSIYTLKKRDGALLVVVAVLAALVIFGMVLGYTDFTHFPEVKYAKISLGSIVTLFAYLILCILPVLIEIKEGLKWKN